MHFYRKTVTKNTKNYYNVENSVVKHYIQTMGVDK